MNGVQHKLIEEIEEHDGQLTDWERKFIDDIQRNDYTLTGRQNEILNKIYGKAVFGGHES